jgi:hypothetical protein
LFLRLLCITNAPPPHFSSSFRSSFPLPFSGLNNGGEEFTPDHLYFSNKVLSSKGVWSDISLSCADQSTQNYQIAGLYNVTVSSVDASPIKNWAKDEMELNYEKYTEPGWHSSDAPMASYYSAGKRSYFILPFFLHASFPSFLLICGHVQLQRGVRRDDKMITIVR